MFEREGPQEQWVAKKPSKPGALRRICQSPGSYRHFENSGGPDPPRGQTLTDWAVEGREDREEAQTEQVQRAPARTHIS